MAENKTKPNKASVRSFLDAIDDVGHAVLEKLIGESVKVMRKRYKVR